MAIIYRPKIYVVMFIACSLNIMPVCQYLLLQTYANKLIATYNKFMAMIYESKSNAVALDRPSLNIIFEK